MLHHQHKIDPDFINCLRAWCEYDDVGKEDTETQKVEALKSQQEAEGVQVVSLTWTRLKYLAMAASFSATLCGCCGTVNNW
jgi:hypothetical protein